VLADNEGVWEHETRNLGQLSRAECGDGGKTKKYGIYMADGASLEDVVIEGFEIAGQSNAGIYAGVGQARRFVIRNNLVHHIRGQGIWLGGTGHLVEKNVIYMIGNDQEARGILISANYKTEAADYTVRGNQIYLCKKEGIRDYGGHSNLIESNIIYGCTYGISLNATRGGTRVLNNCISKVIHGYNPKHTTTDNLAHTYWVSAPHNRDQWILYDLGAEKAFQYIVLVPYQHKVQYNVCKYAFDVSSDGTNFRRFAAGENNDSGSLFIYEFDPPAKGRFLRFNMLENFPDDGLDWTVDAFVVSDVWVVNLVPRSSPEPRSPLGKRPASDTPAVISEVFGNIGSVFIE